MKKLLIMLFGVVISLSLCLTGCRDNQTLPPYHTEHQNIRIGYTSEHNFNQRFGNLIQQQFPDYRTEVIPLMEAIKSRTPIEDWLKSNSVDLIYVNSSQFQSLIDDNLLSDLGNPLSKDPSIEESIIPQVFELTKLFGQGKVFGLPSNFYSQAIIYNQDQYDQASSPYPGDGMSWDEFLTTIPKEGGLSVHATSPFHFLTMIGQSSNLKMIDSATGEVTIDTPAWNRIWKMTIDAVKNGSLHLDAANDNPFIQGNRSAALISYEEFKIFEQAMPDFRWSMTTIPSASASNETNSSIVADGFWVIPFDSPHPQEAWNILTFLLSDKVARWGYRSAYGFSTLSRLFSQDSTYSEIISAFYRMRPRLASASSWPDSLPEIVNKYFEEIVSDSTTLEAGLKSIQSQAEALNDSSP
ncbi:ABC transporter substrate-binding protein [Cohnella fermenti]|uniref:Extracellular solute-binding protein n=1 Tax=Cohnella fermenti TaxID=2565925 RepID=A0A4S4C4U5_9BACL|nr:extracellular solute-binding protein [Cohnella fermenti]THF82602.1 extracellular solute-binding protein [Cohnella fermenti]